MDRLPANSADAVGLWVASFLLVLELLYLFPCRPDIRGRAVRRVLITPTDVKKALVVTRSAGAALRVLARTFIRRTA